MKLENCWRGKYANEVVRVSRVPRILEIARGKITERYSGRKASNERFEGAKGAKSDEIRGRIALKLEGEKYPVYPVFEPKVLRAS